MLLNKPVADRVVGACGVVGGFGERGGGTRAAEAGGEDIEGIGEARDGGGEKGGVTATSIKWRKIRLVSGQKQATW